MGPRAAFAWVVVVVVVVVGVRAEETQWHSLAAGAETGGEKQTAAAAAVEETKWHCLGQYANTLGDEAENNNEKSAATPRTTTTTTETQWHSLSPQPTQRQRQSDKQRRRSLEDGAGDSSPSLEDRGAEEPQIVGEPKGAAAAAQRKRLRDQAKEAFVGLRKALRGKDPLNIDDLMPKKAKEKGAKDFENEVSEAARGEGPNAESLEAFLKQEWSLENLMFLKAVKKFKDARASGKAPPKELEDMARDIYNEFLDKAKAETLVNLPDTLSRPQEKMFGLDESGAPKALDLDALETNFDGSVVEITSLIAKDSFRRFILSKDYVSPAKFKAVEALKSQRERLYRAAAGTSVSQSSASSSKLSSSGLTTMMSTFGTGLASAASSDSSSGSSSSF